ncbi:MAG: PLP-dependent aminotransferase family protein [Candidatus Heimdallarchaeota archaeon]|nr:PLP-dependent aminotransferase family protein [Candidatus Heimdallarchaeota archaeon]
MNTTNISSNITDSSDSFPFADWVNFIRESEIRRLLRFSPQYYFAGGKPGVIPVSTFHQIIRNIILEEEKAFQKNDLSFLNNYNYGRSEGNPVLRQVLCTRLKKRDGLRNIEISDVVLTNGSQQALYAICDTIIRPGDIILAARPTYLGFLQPAEKMGGKIVTIPSDNQGLIPDFIPSVFQKCLSQLSHTPKFLYIVPYSDNPKGTTLPESRKKTLVDYAFEYDFLLVEDMAYKEIQFENPSISPMKKWDPENERIIYLSTSTKEAAAFRIGYNVFPTFLKNEIIKAKGIYDLCSSEWVQAILTEYYSKHIDKALPQIKKEYKLRRNAMLKVITEWKLGNYTHPTGGFFIWFESDDKTFNSSEFLDYSLKHDVSFVPGGSFFAQAGLEYTSDNLIKESIPKLNTMRLGYSLLPPDQIERGMSHLGELLNKYLNS